jgi:hypothetical protein
MIKLRKNLWMALLLGTVPFLCHSSNALALDPVYGNTSVRGFKNMLETVGVGGGPTSYFREYSTGVPEYDPGTGPTGIFANGGPPDTTDTHGNRNRSANMVDNRQSTIMRTTRLNFANRRSDLVNPSSEIGTPAKQKSVRGQPGNKLAETLSSALSDIPDMPATANGWTNNKLLGGKYAKSGSQANETGSGDYSGGLAQRKSALADGQGVFGTTARTLTQQRNQFRYNAANLGQTKNPSAFGRMTGIADAASLANHTSSLK